MLRYSAEILSVSHRLSKIRPVSTSTPIQKEAKIYVEHGSIADCVRERVMFDTQAQNSRPHCRHLLPDRREAGAQLGQLEIITYVHNIFETLAEGHLLVANYRSCWGNP